MKLTGKMIGDALHDGITKWKNLRVHVQESHIRTAQALNVELGLIPNDKREYILSTSTEAYETSDIPEIVTLIDNMDEDFTISTIVNGHETGYGSYGFSGSDIYIRSIETNEEEYGDAIGLLNAIKRYKEEHQVQA